MRYVFFGIAIVGLVLYIMRFVRVPSERRTIEQKMVAVASVLLIMFNDPFYPITVLKPNGARYSEYHLVPSSVSSSSSIWWLFSCCFGWWLPIASTSKTGSWRLFS